MCAFPPPPIPSSALPSHFPLCPAEQIIKSSVLKETGLFNGRVIQQGRDWNGEGRIKWFRAGASTLGKQQDKGLSEGSQVRWVLEWPWAEGTCVWRSPASGWLGGFSCLRGPTTTYYGVLAAPEQARRGSHCGAGKWLVAHYMHKALCSITEVREEHMALCCRASWSQAVFLCYWSTPTTPPRGPGQGTVGRPSAATSGTCGFYFLLWIWVDGMGGGGHVKLTAIPTVKRSYNGSHPRRHRV